MTFNDKVDEFMKNNNIANLKQLALSSGIPYTTLRDFYEKKSADNSRLSTIRKLCEFMGCSMDYLAYDEITDCDIKEVKNLKELYDTLKREQLEEIKKEQLDDLSALDNVLYSKKDKIDSVKNLPIEKQQVIANAVKSVLDMIDDENSNNY